MGKAANLANIGSIADTSLQFRNRIINGDMRIDQRNAGASVTPSSLGDNYTLDRWNLQISQASKLSVQQNAGAVTPPTGFANYLGVTTASAFSVGASDYFSVQTRPEGFNWADLAWGTASASSVTLSFQVRSSLTGTFGGSIRNFNGTRAYPFSYTISAANTWETKTIIIPGETSGSWNTTNGIGAILAFGLGTGSSFSGTAGAWVSANLISATGATSVVGTNGATFYITGVQLEAGTVASPFERRDYGRELAMCQRYAYVTSGNEACSTLVTSATQQDGLLQFPVTMRATPTLTTSGAASGALLQTWNDTQSASTIVLNQASIANARILVSTGAASTWTTGQSGRIYFGWASSGQKVIMSAEL